VHKFLKNLGATIQNLVTQQPAAQHLCASGGGGGGGDGDGDDGNDVTSAKGTALDLALMVWVDH
jgi:hypothetical protein